jgi:hypothetical protein
MEQKESLGKYWERKIKKISKSDHILSYCQKRIINDIKNAMNCGQNSAVIFQFSLESSNEITYSLQNNNDNNSILWFPYNNLKKDCFKKTTITTNILQLEDQSNGGFLLNFRFKALLDWILQEGLGFYMTTSLNLVIFWDISTAKSNFNNNMLYKYFMEQLIFVEEENYKKYYKIIKNAMDSGQTSSFLCSLYYKSDYNEMTEDDIVDIDFIYEDLNKIRWFLVKNIHQDLVLNFIKKQNLKWFLNFPENDKYDFALLKVFW